MSRARKIALTATSVFSFVVFSVLLSMPLLVLNDDSSLRKKSPELSFVEKNDAVEMKLRKSALKDVTIVMVVCGEKDEIVQQTVTALKSVALFSRNSSVRIIILSDDQNQNKILAHLEYWPKAIRSILKISFRPIWYPKGYEWMKKYRVLCTTERLYLPVMLSDVDAVIYLDTDILFFDYVDKLWNFFTEMDSMQFAAMAAEHEDPENAFYISAYNKIPFYGPLGLNAGVILMNLTRMRHLTKDWTTLVHEVYEKYKYSPLHFADQDILNIIFHMYPEKLLPLPCSWNYRSDHCSWKANTCNLNGNGISLIHGNRNVFNNNRDLTFRSLYKAFWNYNYEPDVKTHLLDPLMNGLQSEFNSLCGNNHTMYIHNLNQLIVQ